jgi:hypothetical protein
MIRTGKLVHMERGTVVDFRPMYSANPMRTVAVQIWPDKKIVSV